MSDESDDVFDSIAIDVIVTAIGNTIAVCITSECGCARISPVGYAAIGDSINDSGSGS